MSEKELATLVGFLVGLVFGFLVGIIVLPKPIAKLVDWIANKLGIND